MTVRLLLDEHYAEAIAAELRAAGHDVIAAVPAADLRGSSDPELFHHAADSDRRIVTENIKDFRPLLLHAIATGSPVAPLLLVPPRRFPRGRGDRTAVIVTALRAWLERADAARRPVEDWLTCS
jgi:predicted nuclease of predicted toxin-antitoxin system